MVYDTWHLNGVFMKKIVSLKDPFPNCTAYLENIRI